MLNLFARRWTSMILHVQDAFTARRDKG